uniref:Uncharacterized protein n=1 Tax=Plectus sambesii TaxID=2011161 RepID=A0A914X555_9BILA
MDNAGQSCRRARPCLCQVVCSDGRTVDGQTIVGSLPSPLPSSRLHSTDPTADPIRSVPAIAVSPQLPAHSKRSAAAIDPEQTMHHRPMIPLRVFDSEHSDRLAFRAVAAVFCRRCRRRRHGLLDGEGPCSVGGSATTAVWRQESPLLCALDGVLALIKCARGHGLWFVSFDRPPTKATAALTAFASDALLATVCRRFVRGDRLITDEPIDWTADCRWLSSAVRVSLQHDFRWARSSGRVSKYGNNPAHRSPSHPASPSLSLIPPMAHSLAEFVGSMRTDDDFDRDLRLARSHAGVSPCLTFRDYVLEGDRRTLSTRCRESGEPAAARRPAASLIQRPGATVEKYTTRAGAFVFTVNFAQNCPANSAVRESGQSGQMTGGADHLLDDAEVVVGGARQKGGARSTAAQDDADGRPRGATPPVRPRHPAIRRLAPSGGPRSAMTPCHRCRAGSGVERARGACDHAKVSTE